MRRSSIFVILLFKTYYLDPVTMPAKVSTKGQLVLPAKIRRKYGISPGREVEVLDFGDEIVIIPPPKERGRGILPFRGDPVSLVSEARVRLHELRS